MTSGTLLQSKKTSMEDYLEKFRKTGQYSGLSVEWKVALESLIREVYSDAFDDGVVIAEHILK